ncbi:hypothetical protein OU995_14030 [Roseateles sp. SL47]|uniref:hypothetical protein n=1 Tax=Roseateles sp. SL47 TaxID=2995138 RepID=UPI00226E45DC|nr:hypothetical protein [Roseateles sp. SL47]WAC70742.1 hypothetical protein OU995_14030 [Roseateles sp. SL47]
MTSYSLRAFRVQQFGELLKAHLDGLREAKAVGASKTLEALVRWRKPGEAFAAMYASLLLPSGSEVQAEARTAAIERVLQVVRKFPELLLRGVISALAWAPWPPVESWLLNALVGSDAVDRVAALRAYALIGEPVPQWLVHARHANPHVRAAACRAASLEHLEALELLAADPDLAVRAEAALAWARLVPSADRGIPATTQAASRLWQCVNTQLKHLDTTTGWDRVQAQRRLDRWLRHLAWLAPLGHPGIPQLVALLPTRLALNLLLHHGDAALMPSVLTAMGSAEEARLAGWVWQCMTGVDLAGSGLTLPSPAVDLNAALSPAQQDADHGLPLPNLDAIAAHPATHRRLQPGERMLQGQALHPHRLRELLDPASNKPQALRALAAQALAQLYPDYALNLRASPEAQSVMLARMGVSV